jgi:hypothetical protein
MTKFSQYTPHSTCYGVHLPVRRALDRRVRKEALSKQSAPDEGRQRIKNLKCKGCDNCSTEHKFILTHFGENLEFF